MTSKEKLLQLRHDFYNSEELNYDSIAYFTSILKDLEILTVLHDKEVALECVKATDNYKDYIRAVQRIYGNVNIDITEQEYNLLKRWLENEKIN